jgi:hypothetical protein
MSLFSRLLSVALSGVPLTAAPLLAQLVGSEPERSPFRDLETTQQLTLLTGWFDAASDAARVGPRPAPLFGVRHDVHLSGPAWLTSRYAFVRTDRRLIDPGMPLVDRFVRDEPATHHVFDIGLTLALTGRKSWRHLVPTVGGGIGLTSDFGATDLGSYRFGTKFAFTFGPGLRIPLANGYSLRFDATNHVYQFQYPGTYFIAASDSSRVLTDTRQRSGWLSNWGFSTGLSVPLFRK